MTPKRNTAKRARIVQELVVSIICFAGVCIEAFQPLVRAPGRAGLKGRKLSA